MLSALLFAAALSAPTAQADAVVHVSTPTVVVRIGQPAPPPPRVVYVAPPPRPVATQEVCHVIDKGPPGPRGAEKVHCVVQPAPPRAADKVVIVHR
ncbi:MAG: hypothetical protein H6741_09065 [Alphaproteobacteria bacterium]|nr:hypothetical protein [Alphaproteobacteria bacterium]